jgi:hypothetical protein
MKPVQMLLAVAALLCTGHTLAHGRVADLSIYDRTQARRLEVYWHDGRAYVAGKPGNEYQITLRSRTGEDLLAVVSVDGVNVITGQTADPSQSGYILAPRGAMDIQGWRKSLSQTAAFYFTSLADSYAARTGRPNDVGVVGVALYRRKLATLPAPIGEVSRQRKERAADAGSAAAEAPLGTGHGRHETAYARYVEFARASAPAEVITLYYDSRANLVARGIIRDAGVPVAPGPRPFPGFVPDPQG